MKETLTIVLEQKVMFALLLPHAIEAGNGSSSLFGIQQRFAVLRNVESIEKLSEKS